MAEDDSAVLLRQYIQQSLVSKATSGSTQLYDQLVQELRSLRQAVRPGGGPAAAAAAAAAAQEPAEDAAAPQQLVLLLNGMGQCVSYVHERKHELLLNQVLDVPLWEVPPSVRGAALELIAHLVVANGSLVQSCVQTLVYSLLPPPGPPQPDARAGQAWEPSEQEARIQDEVLATTEKVLCLVPTSGARMLPLLLSSMPHKLRDRGTHCLYLRALFALAESSAGAAIREGILSGVLDHLIAVDVEIRWEDIVDVVTEEAKEEEGGLPPEDEPDIFELEGMSELELHTYPGEDDEGAGHAAMRGGWEGGHAKAATAGAAAAAAATSGAGAAANGEAAGANGAAPAPVNEVADKLDSMMELTFAHLQRRLAAGQLRQAWETLLAAFERSVLHVHRSKFAQFLVFYVCRAAPEDCPRAFLDLLLSRLTDRHQPPITRSACAAYAASFLARAAYVPEALVVSSLQRMADWCLKYERDDDRRGGLPPIPSSSNVAMLSGDAHVRHAAFYAACQALLYVLCYHMEPLLRQRPHTKAGGAGQQQAGSSERRQQEAAGPSGGTPASMDSQPAASGHQSHSHHEQQRAACAAAVREMFAELPQLLTHRLDPLGSCARSVVVEFGRQARLLGFPELARLIKDWERRQAAGMARQSRPLEMFFPFDPYLLSRSAAYLELPTTFVRWRRGHPAGAVRADLESDASSSSSSDDESSSGDEEDEEMLSAGVAGAAAEGRVKLSGGTSDSSGLEDSSSSDDSSGSDSSSTDSSESEGEESDSSADDLKRTRFGSMPGSSFGSDRRPSKKRSFGARIPPALKASLMHGSSVSPTQGFIVGSGSPFGTSPYSTGCDSPFGPTHFGAPPLPPSAHMGFGRGSTK